MLALQDELASAIARFEEAITLEPGFAPAEAHASLANFKLWCEHDREGCEIEFRRALELNPSYAYAHDQPGLALAFQGRLDAAVAGGRRASGLDPLSPQIYIDASIAFAWKEDYETARRLVAKAKEPRATGPVRWPGEDRAFDPLRSEPRFAALLSKVGLEGTHRESGR